MSTHLTERPDDQDRLAEVSSVMRGRGEEQGESGTQVLILYSILF
jgi:hypothetical protein